jgi:hypothetical protein
MKYTFEFLDADSNVHEVIEKTHHYSTLEDDDEEPLLYMQDNPKHAALIDALPSSPKFDQHENICPAPWSQAIKVLIVPLIVIIGHGLWQ